MWSNVLFLLLAALASPAFAQKSETEVSVSEGAPLAIECSLRVEQRVEWRVDGGAAPAPDLRPTELPPAGGLARARLAAPEAHGRHAGVYTCARGPDAHSVHVRVLPRTAPPAPGTDRS